MAAAFIHDAPLAPASTGKRNKAFGPMSKLFGSESAIIVGHDLTSLAAPQALFQNNPDLARLERAPHRAPEGASQWRERRARISALSGKPRLSSQWSTAISILTAGIAELSP